MLESPPVTQQTSCLCTKLIAAESGQCRRLGQPLAKSPPLTNLTAFCSQGVAAYSARLWLTVPALMDAVIMAGDCAGLKHSTCEQHTLS